MTAAVGDVEGIHKYITSLKRGERIDTPLFFRGICALVDFERRNLFRPFSSLREFLAVQFNLELRITVQIMRCVCVFLVRTRN
jgi:hypothetical protein